MKFFRKKKLDYYVVASHNIATGERGYGHPLTSKLAAERFAGQFNKEEGPVIYSAQPCTDKMLHEVRKAAFHSRAESLELDLFDRRIAANRTLQIRLQTQSSISLLCVISQTGPFGAVLYVLRTYVRSLRFDLQFRWYAFWHRRQIQEDLEMADIEEMVGEMIDE